MKLRMTVAEKCQQNTSPITWNIKLAVSALTDNNGNVLNNVTGDSTIQIQGVSDTNAALVPVGTVLNCPVQT